MSSGVNAPKSRSSFGNVWRRSNGEGWMKWGSTEFPALRPTSRLWKLPLTPVSNSDIKTKRCFLPARMNSSAKPCVSSWSQTIRTCLSWWGKWTWTPSPEPWSCISASCQNRFSQMSCIPTLLEASVCLFTSSRSPTVREQKLYVLTAELLSCSSVWQRGQGELHAQPAAVSAGA